MTKRLNEHGERLTKREAASLRTKLGSHAKSNCANYDSCGACPFATCVVEIQAERIAANVCPYFNRNVLPSDPVLEEAYYNALPDGHALKPKRHEGGKESGKRCATCLIRFNPRSNAQAYCDSCSVERRREKEAARKREARYKKMVKGA